MTILYPLLFEDNFHRTVWGGNRLKPLKGLSADDDPIGESWEVSAVPGSTSVVKNGPLKGRTLSDITAEYGDLLLGKAVMQRYNGEFPLLVKFIDARRDLSIQVHPDDELARQRHNCFGKTEMWYVMKAEPGACLYSGLAEPISRYEYEHRVADGSICDVLARHEVKAGDVFFIPAGRIHAICGGILLAEVQQSSDVTYRIFDYNRPGLDGKPRQLHTELAVDAIDFNIPSQKASVTAGSMAAVAPQPLLAGQRADLSVYRTEYEHVLNKPVPLIVNEFFIVKLLKVNRPFHRKLYKYDSFIIYMCLEGDCSIRINSTQGFGVNPDSLFGASLMPAKRDCIIRLTEGNSCLIPAGVADIHVTPHNSEGVTRLLEAYIDNKNY